jgi:hypothetical protein
MVFQNYSCLNVKIKLLNKIAKTIFWERNICGIREEFILISSILNNYFKLFHSNKFSNSFISMETDQKSTIYNILRI